MRLEVCSRCPSVFRFVSLLLARGQHCQLCLVDNTLSFAMHFQFSKFIITVAFHNMICFSVTGYHIVGSLLNNLSYILIEYACFADFQFQVFGGHNLGSTNMCLYPTCTAALLFVCMQPTDNVAAAEELLRRPVTPGRGNLTRDSSRDNFHVVQQLPSAK